jgi:hypothetical protein
MKAIINVLLLSVFTTTSYSQYKAESKLNELGVNNIDLSEVVVKSAGKEMSVYVRDVNVDPKVAKLEKTFIDYDLGKNAEEFDSSWVVFELENGNGRILATYNENGRLTSVIESYKNVVLPISISRSVYKEYPGWQIVNDKYRYSQENGENIKKEYRLTMKKDNKTQKIIVNPVGEVVAIR